MRILGLSGSLRRGSHNTNLLRAAARALPPGVELVVYDGLADLPHYDEDLDVDPPHAAVARLRAEVAAADGVLIATPEFNGSIPGALKNALDWASRPTAASALRGKPAAVVGASTGLFGAVWAQAEVRKVLGIVGAEVVDGELPVAMAASAFVGEGALADPGIDAALAELVAQLCDRVGVAA